MKSIQILLIFISVVVILLTGCSNLDVMYSPEDYSPEDLCNKISSAELKTECKENIGDEVETTLADCSRIRDLESKYTCITEVNARNPNLETCDLIASINDREACLIDVAGESGDIEICHNLNQSNGWKFSCYVKVGAKTNDKSVCENLRASRQDSCIESIARSSTDKEICNEIGDIDIKNKCKSTVAILSDDLDLCRESGQDICILRIAALRGDESLCKELGDKERSCYFTVASDSQQPSICNKVDKMYVNPCLVQSVRGIFNPNICEGIKHISYRNTCFYSLVESHY